MDYLIELDFHHSWTIWKYFILYILAIIVIIICLWNSSLLFCVAELYSLLFLYDNVYIYTTIYLYSILNGHLYSFQFGAGTFTDVLLWMNILCIIFNAQKHAFLLGIYFKVQLLGHRLCAYMYSASRYCPSVSLRDCTNLDSYQQWKRFIICSIASIYLGL